MSPDSCTKVILPHFFSQINLSLILRLQIKIYFKTQCLLVSSWSLVGHGGSWLTLRWCQKGGGILWKLQWNFNQDWTLGTKSRLHLSSKSPHGVLEDMEVPDKPGDGVIWHVSIIWSCSENFIKIQHQEPCQDSTHPPSPFLESWRRCRLLMNLEMVPYDMN